MDVKGFSHDLLLDITTRQPSHIIAHLIFELRLSTEKERMAEGLHNSKA